MSKTFRRRLSPLLALILLALALMACTRTEGANNKGKTSQEALKLKVCHTSDDCGTGRYCDKPANKDSGLCSADCELSMDCYYKDPQAIAAWEKQKAAGIPFDQAVLPPLKFWCSPCGHCVEKTALADPICGPITNIPCNDDSACPNGGVCHPFFKICSHTCTPASAAVDCKDLHELTGYTYECADYTAFVHTPAALDGDAEQEAEHAPLADGDAPEGGTTVPAAVEKTVSLCQEKWRLTVRCTPSDALEGDSRCGKFMGEGFVCTSDGVCAYSCADPWAWVKESDGKAHPFVKAEDQCSTKVGEGYFCMADSGRNVCQKWCLNDSSCAYWGYNWECKFNAPIDPEKNFFSQPENTTYGRCVPREGVNYGPIDKNSAGYTFVGVYGAINDSTFTNCGFPIVNCQDSVNVQHLLFKVYQGKNASGEETVVMDGKYCHHEMANFVADPSNRSKDDTTAKNYAWMVVPKRYTLHTHFHHWNLRLLDIPAIGDGSGPFWTDWYPEVRGALFEEGKDPGFFTPTANYPMPTHHECENTFTAPACTQWDQDRDGNVGLTTQMAGAIQGFVYNDNRAFQRAYTTVVKVDSLGRVNKLKALLQTDNETHVLGATKSSFIIDPTPNYYKDWERSYTRMLRIPENATCKDIESVGVDMANCGNNVNARVVDPGHDLTYICHTPTIDGATENPGPVKAPPVPGVH